MVKSPFACRVKAIETTQGKPPSDLRKYPSLQPLQWTWVGAATVSALPVCISWLVSGCTQCIVVAAAGVGQAASPTVARCAFARCAFAHPACGDVSASDVEACIHALRRPRYRTCPSVWGRWLAELDGGKGEPAAKEMMTEGDVRRELQDRLTMIAVERGFIGELAAVGNTNITVIPTLTDGQRAALTLRACKIEERLRVAEKRLQAAADAADKAEARAMQLAGSHVGEFLAACARRVFAMGMRTTDDAGARERIMLNPCLRLDSALWKAFAKGIAAHPDAPVIIGFHGTPNPGALLHEGFDSSLRRAGQAFGPGEYFEMDIRAALDQAGETALAVVMLAILRVADATSVCEHEGRNVVMVHNPADESMTYRVPIGVMVLVGRKVEEAMCTHGCGQLAARFA